MFCSECGQQLPDDARFCGVCGAPVNRSDAPPPAGAPLVPPPGATEPPAVQVATPREPTIPPPPSPPERVSAYGSYGPAAPQPPKKGHAAVWIGIAAAVVIIALAVAVPLIVLAGDDDEPASTTTVSQPPSSTVPTNSSTSVAPTSTSVFSSTSTSVAPSTTITPPGVPGDSEGEWVRMDLPGLPAPARGVSASDRALLLEVETGDGRELYAYMLDLGTVIELPVSASEFYGEDIDGLLAIWWEGEYDEESGRYHDERLYAFRLPDGPKVEVVARTGMFYPLVAGQWITWVEGEPWEENPEEYWLLRVLGTKIDSNGSPQSEPVELVPSATAFALGDSVWTYDLSETHITWEQSTAVGLYEAGTYVMDLSALQPLVVGNEAWRPSLGDGKVAYFQDGLKTVDLATGQVQEIDAAGDFPTAASTYVAYFRSTQSDDQSAYEVVARGYDGKHEQALGLHSDPPWLSPLIAASESHVAFAADGLAHAFEWQGR